jgi:hypothetical protein
VHRQPRITAQTLLIVLYGNSPEMHSFAYSQRFAGAGNLPPAYRPEVASTNLNASYPRTLDIADQQIRCNATQRLCKHYRGATMEYPKWLNGACIHRHRGNNKIRANDSEFNTNETANAFRVHGIQGGQITTGLTDKLVQFCTCPKTKGARLA